MGERHKQALEAYGRGACSWDAVVDGEREDAAERAELQRRDAASSSASADESARRSADAAVAERELEAVRREEEERPWRRRLSEIRERLASPVLVDAEVLSVARMAVASAEIVARVDPELAERRRLVSELEQVRSRLGERRLVGDDVSGGDAVSAIERYRSAASVVVRGAVGSWAAFERETPGLSSEERSVLVGAIAKAGGPDLRPRAPSFFERRAMRALQRRVVQARKAWQDARDEWLRLGRELANRDRLGPARDRIQAAVLKQQAAEQKLAAFVAGLQAGNVVVAAEDPAPERCPADEDEDEDEDETAA